MSRKTGTLFDFEIAYHRNGVSGNGFHAIKFKEQRGRQADNMIAIVFNEALDAVCKLTHNPDSSIAEHQLINVEAIEKLMV